MARVSLIEEASDEQNAGLIASLKGGRGGRLINIYKMLLHSPEIARTWFEANNAVRWSTELDGFTREVVIIRIGYLNRVSYVIGQRVMRLAAPEGLTEAQCEALKDWRGSGLFDAKQQAVLALVDAMTLDIDVPETAFEALRSHFNERQIVELVVLTGFYNMHTRVLAALDINPEPQPAGAGS